MTCRVVKSGIFLALIGVLVLPSFASTNQEARVRDATRVLQDILNLPEKGIPVSLLSESSGIVVIPGVIKAGYIIGGRHGRGILVARLDHGQWSNPVFITLRAGSIGWQIGVQSTDLVLLFRSKKSVESIVQEEFTLGADASVAAGPHGRGIGAGTDVQFDSEIYSYAISRGFFAGVSLEGASLQIDYSATEAYYDDPDVSIEAILRSPPGPTPDSATKFRQVLVEYEARDTE